MSTPANLPTVPRLTPGSLVLPAPPASWPAGRPLPASVTLSEERFHAARDALEKERSGFIADLTVTPSLSGLKRDDPPRPIEFSSSLSPTASMTWQPLRSEVLLAEARVLEAFTSWMDAWREACLAAWLAPVRIAQAVQAHADVVERIATLRREAVEARATDGRSQKDRESFSFALREAELDVRDAEHELEEARTAAQLAGASGEVEVRFPVLVGEAPSVASLPSYRAVMLRAAAAVARSERRRLAAVLPSLSVAVGVAGSWARADAEWELAHGRPRASLQASLDGTPQERAWASIEASFRLGSDVASLERDVRDAKRVLQREHDAFLASHDAQVRVREEAWRRANEHWQLAEDRLVWLEGQASPKTTDVVRAGKEVRTWWVRMVVASARLSEVWGSWPLRT